MHHLDLLLTKIVCAVALTVSSLAGAVVPSWLLSFQSSASEGSLDSSSSSPSLPGGGPRRRRESSGCFGGLSMASPEVFMPLGNTYSAGLLIGAGLLHFLASAVKESIIAVASTGGAASPVPAAKHHENASHEEARLSISEESIEAAVGSTLVFLVFGLLLPLAVDRVFLGRQGHSHSHGHSHGHDDAAANGANEDGSPTAPTAAAAMQSSVVSRSRVLLIAALLSVHCIMEGVMLGMEDSIHSLRTAMVAMTLHKFFDGLVLGLAVARSFVEEEKRHSAGTPPAGKMASSPLRRALQDRAVFLWLGTTPIAMILTAFAGGADSSPGAMTLRSAVQGIGAGGFIYIAMELLSSEIGSLAAAAIVGPAQKLVSVVAGVATVWMLEHGHHHHH